jgi:hypothetical protein
LSKFFDNYLTKTGINHMKKPSLILLPLAITTGLVIGWIDSRPNWDDTGISVLIILSAATFWGYLLPRRPWMIALAVSIWVPLLGIVLKHNVGGSLALIPGFIGAYLGSLFKDKFTER